MNNVKYEEPPVSRFIFGDTRVSWFWLLARFYVGFEWISAGWGKLNSGWVGGDSAGNALSGFMKGALAKTAGDHPDVQGWYAYFLEHVILPHAALWSHVVTYGEMLVGLALIIGAFTGIAAFFGLFMNLNFMLAGAVSINPILFTLSIGLVLAWRIAGEIGLDKYLLPSLGTYWQPGKIFKQDKV